MVNRLASSLGFKEIQDFRRLKDEKLAHYAARLNSGQAYGFVLVKPERLND